MNQLHFVFVSHEQLILHAILLSIFQAIAMARPHQNNRCTFVAHGRYLSKPEGVEINRSVDINHAAKLHNKNQNNIVFPQRLLEFRNYCRIQLFLHLMSLHCGMISLPTFKLSSMILSLNYFTYFDPQLREYFEKTLPSTL